MTLLLDALKDKIATAEKAAATFNDAPAWRKVAYQHAARIMALETAYNDARAAVAETSKARGAAGAALENHDASLLTVDLAAISEWAIEGRRLSGTLEALVERQRREGVLMDAAKRRLQNARAENPAAVAKAQHIGDLRAILLDDISDEKTKRKAWDELGDILENEKPRIVEIMPPGFNPNLYDKHGNLKSNGNGAKNIWP